MATITYKVEIAFVSTPLAVTPTWVDVTAWWQAQLGVTITRGRPDEFSDPQPGTLRLVLDNADGRFTMGNTSSPYYPNVAVNKQIRFTATVSGVDYVRFQGHVDDWPLTYEGGVVTAGLVTLSATDRMKLVARRGTLRSFLTEEIALDSPDTYLPLSDPSGAVTVKNLAATPFANGTMALANNQASPATYAFGSGTGPGADGTSGLLLTPSGVDGWVVDVPLNWVDPGGFTNGTTLEVWVNTTATQGAFLSLMSGHQAAWELINDVGTGFVWAHTPVATFGSTAGNTADGRTHHVAFTSASAGTLSVVYVDGVAVMTQVGGVLAYYGTRVYSRMHVGGLYPSPFAGTLAHAAAYRTALSATRITAHYQAGHAGYGGERSDQRIAHLAKYVGIPTASQVLETGVATIWGQSTGVSCQGGMNDVARTEGGLVFFDRINRLVLQNRYHRYNPTAVFSVAATDLQGGLQWNLDNSRHVNDVTASTEDGVEQRALNSASVAKYGTLLDPNGVMSLLTRDPADAYQAAAWRAYGLGEPLVRCSAVAIDLGTLPDATATAVLPVEISDMFTVTGLPAATAPVTSLSLIVEGYAETIAPGEHLVAFNTSGAALYVVAEFDTSTFDTVFAY